MKGIAAGGAALLPAMLAAASHRRMQVRSILSQALSVMQPWQKPAAAAWFAANAPVWLLIEAPRRARPSRNDLSKQWVLARRSEAIAWALQALRKERPTWDLRTSGEVAGMVGPAPALAAGLKAVVHEGFVRGYIALNALASIGGADAIEALEIGLRHADDWKMVVRAAEIVSQLRPAADGARSSLRFVADEHWSPAVRAFAVDVLQTLDDLSAPARKLNPSAVSFTHGYKWCVPESGYTEGPDATGNEVSVPRNPVWRFSYQGTVQERRLADWPKAAIPSEFPVACYRGVPANPCSWIDLPGDPLGETTIQPVQNGWLVSIHRGEFGGVVLFIAREGTGHRLADAVPVEGFAVVPGGMLGFHAYCQSGCQGVVQRLESNHGEWHVTRTTELPSAPRGIWREADGTILVATEQGVVSLDASGAITGFPGCL